MDHVIKVFLASASREFIELLQGALEQEPDFCVVGTARAGDDVYARLPDSRADLLVTDLLLPGLDGLTLLRRLRSEGRLPRVIVVSGFYNDHIAQIVSSLADDYLTKPCRIEDLMMHMRECVFGIGCVFVRDYDALVSRALMDCGILPHLNGSAYLHACICRALEDRSQLRGITKSLYRDVAKQFGTTPECVERSIRSAIRDAWKKKTPEQRRSTFGSLFDVYAAKAPTNLPFLTAMTEYVEDLFIHVAGEP